MKTQHSKVKSMGCFSNGGDPGRPLQAVHEYLSDQLLKILFGFQQEGFSAPQWRDTHGLPQASHSLSHSPEASPCFLFGTLAA